MFLVASNVANQVPIFAISDTKPFAPVADFSNWDKVNYCDNLNQVLKEQLIGTKINQKYQ